MKVLPSPGLLSTSSLPRINSTRRLVITKPIPVPSITLNSAPRRLNGLNSSPRRSGDIPGPVSAILIRARPCSPREQFILMLPPSLLYLTALLSRFKNTCFNLIASASTSTSLNSAGSNSILILRSFAMSATQATQPLITFTSDIASIESSILPVSILDKSRISSIKLSRCWPALLIARASDWRCSPRLASYSNNCENPRIAFKGVRSSWLMFERNSVLALLAFSATVLASIKSVSYFLRSVTSSTMVRILCQVSSSPWTMLEIRRISNTEPSMRVSVSSP